MTSKPSGPVAMGALLLLLTLGGLWADADESDAALGPPAGGDVGAGDQWLQPIPADSSISDWDLYTGRIYATTSPLWLKGEYLLWWLRGNSLPAMVTTSPAGTVRSDAGVLGAPATQVLFGDGRVDGGARSGFRIEFGARLGWWFDSLMDAELESSLLWVGHGLDSGDFFSRSLGDPILARPFYNAAAGQQDAQLIAFPGVATGQIAIESSSELLSAGVRFRRSWLRTRHGRIDWLAGYRYLQFQESLQLGENLVSVDPGGLVPVGTSFDIFEQYKTWNEFHGADLGLQFWTDVGHWSVEVLTKVAIGSVARTIEINGDTFVFPPGGPGSLTAGGLYALPTNLGRYRSSRPSALPEIGVRFRRQISPTFLLTMGYTLMYLDHVVRTGDQLDLVVNPTQTNNGTLVGAPRPTVLMNDSAMWVHGFQVGLEW